MSIRLTRFRKPLFIWWLKIGRHISFTVMNLLDFRAVYLSIRRRDGRYWTWNRQL